MLSCRALIAFIEGNDPFAWKGYLLAFTMYVVVTITSLTNNHRFDACYLVAMRMRCALVSAIYRKVSHSGPCSLDSLRPEPDPYI